MAVILNLVKQSSNWLRYLYIEDGEGPTGATITTTGAVSPDIRTDSVGSGPLKKLAKTVPDGFGQFAAGAQTQAKARALFLSDWTGIGGDPGNENQTTARIRIVPRVGVGAAWTADCNVDGGGNPTITISENQLAEPRSAYIDIEVPQAIGAGGISNSL
jgi:hypothetical protein